MPPAPTPPHALTPERILEATEEVLRRYGPAKATVVDVARVLGVSHGSVYRHFRTKAALREAVTSRWLDLTSETLREIAAGPGPAEARLERWVTGLFEAKRHKAGDDPELFATYLVLAGENSEAVERHIEDLVGQLAGILRQGVEEGRFDLKGLDLKVSARAVFDATGRFHDPAYTDAWSQPGIDEALTALLHLVLHGLCAPRA